jgi:ferric-dicitrate binding protein FerR (iron transport regulator)
MHPEKPFRVYTGKIVTTALGTAFNISAYLTTDTAISISLLNGKISVMPNNSAKASDIRYLTPGMNIRFENDLLQREKQDNNSRNTLAWMDHKIAFDSASIKEVCRRLSYHFGVRIVAGNGVGKQRVSGIFKTTDRLKTIIHAITYVHDLKVTDTGDGYVISAR